MRVEFVILMALSLVMGVSLGFVGMRGFVAAVQTATSMPPIERALVQEGVTPEGPGSTSIGALVARLTIPRLRTEWFVVSAITPDALQGALGHVPGTAFPGDEGHCVIAGRYETHFNVLKHVQEGDHVVVEVSRGQVLYRVTETALVSATDATIFRPSEKSLLTLLTCCPFNHSAPVPQRFIVRAELVNRGPFTALASTEARVQRLTIRPGPAH